MPNHFTDRERGEIYDLNGAPVVLMRQRSAPWGQTWVVRYVDEGPDAAFSIEPGYLDDLGWELLGRDGKLFPSTEGAVCPRCGTPLEERTLESLGFSPDHRGRTTSLVCPVGHREVSKRRRRNDVTPLVHAGGEWCWSVENIARRPEAFGLSMGAPAREERDRTQPGVDYPTYDGWAM